MTRTAATVATTNTRGTTPRCSVVCSGGTWRSPFRSSSSVEQILDWFGYSIDGAWAAWVGPVLGTVVYLWGGRPFLVGWLTEVRNRQPGMMLLISLAITVAYVSSLAATIGWGDLDFWWELVALIVVMLLGHWQEMKAIGQAQGALAALAELLPDTAERVSEDGTRVGRHRRPGRRRRRARPARRAGAGRRADRRRQRRLRRVDDHRGVPTRSTSRAATGSSPAPCRPTPSVRVQRRRVGEDTALAGIQRMVADAQSVTVAYAGPGRPSRGALFYRRRYGAASSPSSPGSPSGDAAEGIVRTVTVLVIACPHALGLAIPLGDLDLDRDIGHGRDPGQGPIALERMRTVDAVLFDKTGTLTKGEPRCCRPRRRRRLRNETMSWPWPRPSRPTASTRSPEPSSPPPTATVTSPSAATSKRSPDAGVHATVDGHDIAVGGPGLLDHLDLTAPKDLRATIEQWRRRGGAVLYVSETMRSSGP